ncbi:hypothetical protein M885DRAFT_471721, partial [Pelagophyceae sp. CCMP2097]
MMLLRETLPKQPGDATDDAPQTLHLSLDAKIVLCDCHALLATARGTSMVPLQLCAGEALAYELWEMSGLVSWQVPLLKKRLKQLTRASDSTLVDAGAFVRAVLAGNAGAPEAKAVPALQVGIDESFAKFKRMLADCYGYATAPPAAAPAVSSAAAIRDVFGAVAEKRPRPESRREDGLAPRPWEVKRREQDAYVEQRLAAKRAEIAAADALAAAASAPLAEADRCKDALTDAEARAVASALRSAPRTVVSDGFNAEVTGEHAARLNPGGWLVDEVVNFYMALLQDRDNRRCKADSTLKPCHFFNSFFIAKLMGPDAQSYSYAGVRRWTKKVDLFAKRIFFAPVNVGNMHWCLAAIDMELKTVRYYDSMGGSGSAYLRALMRYLGDEHQDKRGSPFDATGWTMVATTPDTPQQSNGFDCGVFASYCAHYVSLGVKPSFSQQNVPHLRRRMMADII